MTLINRDNGEFVWVDVDNDSMLSPIFCTEEKAYVWYSIISKHIFDEYGITDGWE